MYLSDLIVSNSNNQNSNLLSQIDQKVIFNSNPIIKQDPIELEETVNKRYLLKVFEKVFGPNFYENNLNNISPVSIYSLNISNAECTEGNPLIFELVISPELIANLKLKLELISSTAIASIDFTNAFYYSEDNLVYTQISDNIITINANVNKCYIKINTSARDDTEYYGDKILILKIREVVLYDSPENPYFIYNDIGVGKIKELKSKPEIYDLVVNNPNVYRDDTNGIIYELKLNKVISNLKVKFEVNNLTAFSEVDYDRIYMKYSVNNGGTWVDNNSNTILHFVNTDKILLKIPLISNFGYRGDKVLILNVNEVVEKPDNSIINIINSTAYATIRDQYLPTIESYINIKDAVCNEGEELVFETELVMAPADLLKLKDTDQIVVYYNVSNITAYSGNDYSEVMYWSVDNINYIATSTRQVIYTKSNLKVNIKFETIESVPPKYKRSLLLKPELIINKPEILNIKLNDIGIGIINDISILSDYYDLLLEDSICKEGNYIVFNLNSNKPLLDNLVLNIQVSDITAIDNIDYIKNSLQYSINEGSTYINSTFNNVIFHKNLTNIKLRLNTIKSSNYNGNRSFLLKIKEVIEKPIHYIINYHDMAIGTIEDESTPPVNHEIKFAVKDYNIKHGNDFIFEAYIYPPILYDGLELKLNIIPNNQNTNSAVENTDYSFRFASFSTNNGLSWSSVSNTKTIILNQNTNYFKIKIPTYQNLSNTNIKNIKFLIEKVIFTPPNSNIDISEAFVLTSITV